MPTLTQNRRHAWLTLLAGLLASALCMPARAQPAIFFDRGCDTCHGPGLIVIDPANPRDPARFVSNGALATYINDSMPPPPPANNPTLCTGACAQDIADYFVPPTPPVANASNSTNLTGIAPLTASFNGSASTDDQGIVAYAWNFGDGATGTGAAINHTYTTVGTYTATLTVTDTRGLQDSDNVTVIVTSMPTPPTADLSNSLPTSGVVPLSVTFDGTASTDDEGIVAYDWDFGDGNTGNGPIRSYLYTVAGTYTVTLTVTDTDGWQDSATLTISIREPEPPTADASASRNLKGAAPLRAQLDAGLSSCEGTCTYAWDFGDGLTNPNSPAVLYTYTTPGTYTATVTVTTSNGLRDTDTVVVTVVQGETLAEYVNACKTQVGFNTLPTINCYDGILFAQSVDNNDNLGATRDFAGYKRIGDNVDLAFACRWLRGARDNPLNAASVEFLVHNRSNGNTCFFSAKHGTGGPDQGSQTVASILPSPTAPNAGDFWDDPAHVDGSGRRCVDCHVAGPYIASPRIASTLARFGLLNDGHDTFVTRYNAVTPIGGGAFEFWNDIVQSHNVPDTCANGCHTIGYNDPIPSVILEVPVLLPSLASVIEDVSLAGVMPPHDPPVGTPSGSNYTWINRDNPFGPGDTGDVETLVEARKEYPKLISYCDAPTLIEAHVVGSDINFAPKMLPDKLAVFNVREGLVCLNSDQDSGQCNDYRLRYQCTAPNGDKTWTDWYNLDSPSFNGDYEARSGASNLCTSPAGSTVTAIEAGVTLSNGWTYTSYGPNDRLAQFDEYGLVCNNSDQPGGQCSNYVVRFEHCTEAPAAYTARLSSAWSNRLLTATATPNNAETRAQPASSWTSQDWVIEPVTDTGYVRLKNVWTGRYLNVQNNSENASILLHDLVPEWTSQQWKVEKVSNSSDVRLRNVWTGRYLTVTDTGNFAAILAQTLNRGWASQRWRIQ